MMAAKLRYYNSADDYNLVSQFLIQHYQPENKDGNWLQPAFFHQLHCQSCSEGFADRADLEESLSSDGMAVFNIGDAESSRLDFSLMQDSYTIAWHIAAPLCAFIEFF
jgi:hypothetical protein